MTSEHTGTEAEGAAVKRQKSVALVRCMAGPSAGISRDSEVQNAVCSAMDAASLFSGRSLRGLRVLVKPNLLRAVPLACTSPAVVAAACVWLMERGAVPLVADSPGFGTVQGVARSIGLDAALAPLGLRAQPMHAGGRVRLNSGDSIVLAREALEADALLSVPRVKAHSQMRLTLACKNLYGCVPGLRKAVLHTSVGQDPQAFASMQAAILDALPPQSALVDGIVAMHETGPAYGAPYALGLVCACSSPVAADEAVCRILGIDPMQVPLQAALVRRGHPDCLASGAVHLYPLLRPCDFSADDFVVPQVLKHTTFRPDRLLLSCIRRKWYELFR